MKLFIIPLFLYISCILIFNKTMTYFRNSKLIDKPSERTNHIIPTPKGAGIILIPLIIFSSGLVFFLNETLDLQWIIYFICCLILLILSFLDDLKSLPSSIRLIFQFSCVGLCLFFLKNEILFFSQNLQLLTILGLSPNFDFFIVTITLLLFWLWIINLFNFMDGMDGITSVQVIFLSLLVNSLTLLGYFSENIQFLSIMMLASFLAFLNFNKPPAKIFLGDSGSIPVGFLCGLIIIKSIVEYNIFIPLLIISMYYFLDSSLTLAIRFMKRKNIFIAHSEHFYQRVLRSGYSHSDVLFKILILSIFLFILSLLSINFKFVSLTIAFLITLILIMYFFRKGKNE